MKKLILMCLFLISGCTNQGSGTTVEDSPVSPTTPPANQTPIFSAQNSSIFIRNNQNSIIINSYPDQLIKISIDARDQFGSAISGISSIIKTGVRFYSSLTDLSVVETVSGRYEVSLQVPTQGYYEVYLKVNGIDQLFTNFSVSYCNSQQSPSATPFHLEISKNSKNYYIICTASQLASINSNPTYFSKNFILGNGIDLSSHYTYSNNQEIPDNQFKIGETIGFNGEFDGNNFSIQNFKYIAPTEINNGLFGKLLSGAKISNLQLISSNVSGESNIGSLAGSIEALASPEVSISSILVSNSNISASVEKLGGLIGSTSATANLINLSNISTNIIINIPNNGLSKIGGIIGQANGINADQLSGFVNLSYSGVNQISSIGGLFGEFTNSSISNSGIISNINISNASNVGCFIGKVENSTLNQNYSGFNCQVNYNSPLSSNMGGLIGYLKNSTLSGISYFINSNTNSEYGSFAGLIEGSTVSDVFGSGNIELNQSSSGFIYQLVDSSVETVKNFISITANSNQISGFANLISGSVILNKISNNNTILANSNSNIYSFILSANNGTISVSNLEENSSITSQGNSSVWGELTNSSLSFSNSLINPSIITQNNTSGLFQLLDSNLSVNLSNLVILTSQSLVPNGSIITTESSSSTITSSNIYWLSEKTQNYSLCSLGDSCGGFSAIDMNTSSNISQDLLYFNSFSNPPLTNWDSTNIWIMGSILPYLR